MQQAGGRIGGSPPFGAHRAGVQKAVSGVQPESDVGMEGKFESGSRSGGGV